MKSKAMCERTIYVDVQISSIEEEMLLVNSPWTGGEFTKSDHMLDQCYWQYKTPVLLPEMERKNLDTSMQFERGILFLLEIIKIFGAFFKKEKCQVLKNATNITGDYFWGLDP